MHRVHVGTRARPMKECENDEQRSERLEKLREQFPWAPRENPSEVIKMWTKREGKDGQKLTMQQQRELLGFGGDDAGGDDYGSDSSDEGGGGSKRRRRRQNGEGEGGGGDSGDDREAKKSRGPGEDGGVGHSSGGPQGDGGDAVYGHLDAEDRITIESVDDWRVGRKLILLMGWSADDGKGLGLHGQGRRRAVEVRGRMGRRGLGSGATPQPGGGEVVPARAGIPKNWPSGTPNDRFAPSATTYQH